MVENVASQRQPRSLQEVGNRVGRQAGQPVADRVEEPHDDGLQDIPDPDSGFFELDRLDIHVHARSGGIECGGSSRRGRGGGHCRQGEISVWVLKGPHQIRLGHLARRRGCGVNHIDRGGDGRRPRRPSRLIGVCGRCPVRFLPRQRHRRLFDNVGRCRLQLNDIGGHSCYRLRNGILPGGQLARFSHHGCVTDRRRLFDKVSRCRLRNGIPPGGQLARFNRHGCVTARRRLFDKVGRCRLQLNDILGHSCCRLRNGILPGGQLARFSHRGCATRRPRLSVVNGLRG